MPGSFKFGGGGSSSTFAFTPPASSKPSGAHGVSGFLDNLAGDVRDSAVGLPTGLVHLATHPVSSVEAMGKMTWQDWSPLFHGNVNKFAHQFYAHPLAPLLDVASVLTGGAGVAGRLANLGLDSSLVTDTSLVGRLAKASQPGKIAFKATDKAGNELPTLFKHTVSNPMGKAQQVAVSKLVTAVAPHLPGWFGDVMAPEARYARLETKMMSPRAAALKTQITTFVRAGKDMSGPAKDVYRSAVMRHSYDQLLHIGKEWDKTKPLPDGYRYVPRVHAVSAGGRNTFFKLSKGGDIESDMNAFSKRFASGKDVTKAHINANGMAIIVPKHMADKFGMEGANAAKSLKLMYSKPVQIWKQALLGYNPAFFVHNAVGNFFMYAMGHGGTAGFKGFTDALSQVKGEASAVRSMGAASHALNPHWMTSNFRDQLNNTFSAATASGARGLSSKLYKYSLFPVTHIVADQFLRRSAINAEMRGAPEVQALMKSGDKFDTAAAKALAGDGKTSTHEAAQNLRERVSQKVMETMGDYHSMNSGERLLASVMPFYTWNRHALRFTKNAAVEHPGRLNIAAKTSNQGTAETKAALGEIPQFLLGSIPGSLIGIKDSPGRKALLETQSLNPLATIPDIVDAGRSLVGQGKVNAGEALGSNLNPVVTNAIQYLTGTSITTGAPVPKGPGGLPGNVLSKTFTSLPQVTLLKRLLGPNPQPHVNKATGGTNPFLFSKNKQAAVSGLLGSHIEQMSPAAAKKEYDKEHGVKSGRKTKFTFGG